MCILWDDQKFFDSILPKNGQWKLFVVKMFSLIFAHLTIYVLLLLQMEQMGWQRFIWFIQWGWCHRFAQSIKNKEKISTHKNNHNSNRLHLWITDCWFSARSLLFCVRRLSDIRHRFSFLNILRRQCYLSKSFSKKRKKEKQKKDNLTGETHLGSLFFFFFYHHQIDWMGWWWHFY